MKDAWGNERGRCVTEDCLCKEYLKPMNDYACGTCGHACKYHVSTVAYHIVDGILEYSERRLYCKSFILSRLIL